MFLRLHRAKHMIPKCRRYPITLVGIPVVVIHMVLPEPFKIIVSQYLEMMNAVMNHVISQVTQSKPSKETPDQVAKHHLKNQE